MLRSVGNDFKMAGETIPHQTQLLEPHQQLENNFSLPDLKECEMNNKVGAILPALSFLV
jgi:hypothetical protein